MRVIVAQLDIDPQARDAFLSYMATYIDTTRAEQGNVGFDLTAHLDRSSRFTMVEQWADDDALRAHFAQPYVQEFLAWRAEVGLEVSGTAFEVTDSGPLMDVLASLLSAPTT